MSMQLAAATLLHLLSCAAASEIPGNSCEARQAMHDEANLARTQNNIKFSSHDIHTEVMHDGTSLMQLQSNIKLGGQGLLSPASPSKLGPPPDYKSIKKVGEGAFGVATIVKNPTNEKMEVWKTPKEIASKAAKVAGTSPAKELANGAKIMQAISHCPNVCQLVAGPGDFQVDGVLQETGYVMPRYTGGDLEQFIAKNKGAKNTVLEDNWKKFKQQFNAALDCIHKKKIAHLDLKPDNVFVDVARFHGSVDFYIADFDKSRDVGSKSAAKDADSGKDSPIIQYYFDALPKSYRTMHGIDE